MNGLRVTAGRHGYFCAVRMRGNHSRTSEIIAFSVGVSLSARQAAIRGIGAGFGERAWKDTPGLASCRTCSGTMLIPPRRQPWLVLWTCDWVAGARRSSGLVRSYRTAAAQLSGTGYIGNPSRGFRGKRMNAEFDDSDWKPPLKTGHRFVGCYGVVGRRD